MTEQKLKDLIEDTIRKLFDEYLEKIKLEIIMTNTPYVNDKEQNELEEMFGEEPYFDEIVQEKNLVL